MNPLPEPAQRIERALRLGPANVAQLALLACVTRARAARELEALRLLGRVERVRASSVSQLALKLWTRTRR